MLLNCITNCYFVVNLSALLVDNICYTTLNKINGLVKGCRTKYMEETNLIMQKKRLHSTNMSSAQYSYGVKEARYIKYGPLLLFYCYCILYW
jgi:hypothetical protein